jgi:twitching motility protein PilT
MSETQRLLKELNFIDIYVCLNGTHPSHYCYGSNEWEAQDDNVPPEYSSDVQALINVLRDSFTGVEKGLEFGGMRLRATKLETASGQTWVALRRIAKVPPPLEKLGFIPQLVPLIRDLGNRSGLILLCGATGQGKTTSVSSMMLDFLERRGGVAFTIEDPVEFMLEGRHGEHGYCYQSEVKDDSQWGEMLKRSLRWHPRYIVVGEVRTPDAADQLLRAATSGHTVLTTMHSGSIEEALEGLLQLAEKELGDRAALLLAAGLSGVIHQSLTPLGINARFMITEYGNSGSPVRSLIREKRIGQSRSIADHQMALLVKDGKIYQNR